MSATTAPVSSKEFSAGTYMGLESEAALGATVFMGAECSLKNAGGVICPVTPSFIITLDLLVEVA